jgi:ATP-dependent helicase/nuclease subunit B
VQLRLLLGPAGCGKTHRCLAEIRRGLLTSSSGAPLLLVVPKQTTYQLERQLLSDPALPGYIRLQILSFERLAHFIFDQLQLTLPRMLDEEGRLMVLRSLLANKHNKLKLFRASARLTGFAQQLSLALRELQQNRLTPEALDELALQVQGEGLSFKLQDLASLLRDYVDWLATHGLQDGDSLLPAATQALNPIKDTKIGRPPKPFLAGLWVDGFAEFSEQELEFLAALIPCCAEASITFCLDQPPKQLDSWLSSWTVVRRSFEKCRQKLAILPGVDLQIERLVRDPVRTRFLNNTVMQHLEAAWGLPAAYAGSGYLVAKNPKPDGDDVNDHICLVGCQDPEGEVTFAARQIRRYVRNGGRYRDVMILVRNLDRYHHALERVFARFDIPLFLDRRESVAHHPLAELTRGALRTVAFQWQPEDWFAALKTGLVPAAETEIDRLENEALARGWRGSAWQKAIVVPDDPELTKWLADLHKRLLPPFHKLALDLATSQNRPNGLELAAALRQFWAKLNVEETLADWAGTDVLAASSRTAGAVHSTVWDRMNAWLDNIELAFPDVPLPLREWLPILEAGLSNLTVGIIPPALDQVLAGSLDRSRNPDIKLAFVLGFNETFFPSAPERNVLLTESDRDDLGKINANFGSAVQRHLARERYLAYVACTRARERVVLTHAASDAYGTPLNPSPFLSHLLQLFPSLKAETQIPAFNWRAAEHVNELIGPLLRMQTAGNSPDFNLTGLTSLSATLQQLRRLVRPGLDEGLSTELAEKLYGKVLRTSVSRMEQFAACPFKFFVHSGLRAQERKRFELDIKEQGTFQHDVLAIFHESLQTENKRWRDISPHEARERIGAISNGLVANYREGLLEASEETRFMARILTESLQDFIETMVSWMRHQYLFDPKAVELPFGEEEDSPAWSIPLPNGCRLELRGRIDRIDLFQGAGSPDGALCVVIDYKSSQKQLEQLLVENGIQLQLLTYLNVLHRWPGSQARFGIRRLIPAGVFYVNLRGKYKRETNRLDALADPERTRKQAYRHTGRFDVRALRQLDGRTEAREGDQFNYRVTANGTLNKNSREALSTAEFEALLKSAETNLKKMGQLLYAGRAEVAPYKAGKDVACQQCDYASICRIDPWTHRYRILRRTEFSS